MINDKTPCAKCGASQTVPTTLVCSACLRADAIATMLAAWACLRQTERDQFLRRVCVRRAA